MRKYNQGERGIELGVAAPSGLSPCGSQAEPAATNAEPHVATIDHELVQRLRERYTPQLVPPCRVCGGELSIARAGGGEATVWACATMEEDPEAPGTLRLKPGRGGADEHYSESRWTQYRSGDDDVIALLDALASAGPMSEHPLIQGLLADAGALSRVRGAIAAPCDRSGEADETATKIAGSAEGESAVIGEAEQAPK
jgi:hypothetical protein